MLLVSNEIPILSIQKDTPFVLPEEKITRKKNVEFIGKALKKLSKLKT